MGVNRLDELDLGPPLDWEEIPERPAGSSNWAAWAILCLLFPPLCVLLLLGWIFRPEARIMRPGAHNLNCRENRHVGPQPGQ